MKCSYPDCNAWAMRADAEGRCYFHSSNPDVCQKRKDAGKRGGALATMTKRGKTTINPPRTPEEISSSMAQVFADVANGKLSMAQAELLTKIAHLILRSTENIDIDRRLKAIEEHHAQTQ